MKKLILTLSIFLFLASSAAEISQQDIQRFSAYYSNGMQYLNQNQYSSAIVEFKKVLRFSPYDATVQSALANAYLARAGHYKNTTKEYKKALNDYKSACFYSKYWKNNPSNTMLSLASSAKGEIQELEKKLQMTQNRLQSAKALKAQGELAAAGYDFQELKNSQYKETAYENLGNIYKNLNNISMAMDYMKTAIDINPKNPKLHFLYGVMLDEAKNYDASIEQYNLALQYGDNSPELLEILENKWTQNIVNNPSDSQGYINLGAIYQKQGNLEAARAQYLKATQMSDDPVGFYNLASLYVQQKNYTAAISVYNQLLDKNPYNVEALNYKAEALKNLGRYEEALKQYDLILTAQPDNKEAKAASENIIFNSFSGEKLQNYLLRKAQTDSNSYEAQFNCALELHKNKKYNEAITYYNNALKLNPSKEEVYLNLASIYIEQKQFSRAAEISQKGLLVLPNNAKLLASLNEAKSYETGSLFDSATKLFEQKRYKEAIAGYLKIQNQTSEVKLALASCYWELGDFNNANKYYLEVLSLEPNNLEALLASAWAYYSLKDFNNAKLSANKILAYDKTNTDAKNLLASIAENETGALLEALIDEYEKGNYQVSINQANKILNQQPDNEYALYYKALSYEELKKPQDALKTYKTLIQKHPDFTDAYYSLAVNLDNSQNYSEAVNNYEKFLSLKGAAKDDMTEFSRSRIKELKDYLNQLNASK